MKITEIKKDMYQYISLRDSIESSKDSNRVVDEEKRTLINEEMNRSVSVRTF